MTGKLRDGLYDLVISRQLGDQLAREAEQRVEVEPIEASESADALLRLLAAPIRRALAARRNDPRGQLRVCETILGGLEEDLDEAPAVDSVDKPNFRRLLGVGPVGLPGEQTIPERPEIPLGQSALLVNARDQPRIGTEVAREIASAERVDLLCAFLKWQGFRILEPAIEEHLRRGRRLRVLTTTYIGATDRHVIDRLHELGAKVRVCYESGRTRLHAKAWLFERETGFHTAYIGSSNLSRAALLDGLEWNVRVTSVEQPHLIDTFRATFEDYWNDPRFELYEPQRDGERFDRAIAKERGSGGAAPLTLSGLEVMPWPHQRRMLEDLEAERELHGRWRNLVVAATGTGKTILSALDYERLRRAGRVDSILFVAHRQEILDQSLRAFREVLRQGDFGERFVGGDRPKAWRHVFASIQSLHRLPAGEIAPDRFDMVVVDEFHHAEAATYERWLNHLKPEVLLGLTATPERADGQDVTHWFDGHTAVELRLWEALEEGLLCPFQYFGLHDGTDLSRLRWSRGGYEVAELERVLSGHDRRAALVLEQLRRKVDRPRDMRALGFCVSVAHAHFMARFFSERNLPALAVSGESSAEERAAALSKLRNREVNMLFSVELFNEGLDLPEVDTVLFLRPTESATVFLQQLGRGLRLAPDKCCLTVLDFIGRQHARFRFDLKFRSLVPVGRRELAREIEAGFPRLPTGCHLELDRVSSEIVLENLRQAIDPHWPRMVDELRHLGSGDLKTFLAETNFELGDLFRGSRLGWTALRRAAGQGADDPGPDDAALGSGIGRLLHVDDPERLRCLRDWVEGEAIAESADERTARLARMTHFAFWGPDGPVDLDALEAARRRLLSDRSRCAELLEVLDLLEERLARVTPPLGHPRIPLHLHASYKRDEIVAAFGRANPRSWREGVLWVEEERSDLFLVTLRKSERHFSPTTRYQDRAVARDLFQWESQSTTTVASPTGQRYLRQGSGGTAVHLFVRVDRKLAGGDTAPFLYLGPASYASHESERPIRILWRLQRPMPEEIFEQYRLAAA